MIQRKARALWAQRVDLGLLLLLSLAALLVHGYHPFAEDSEIYLPGVEKLLHPQLFPVGSEFFASHAHLTLFPNLIAFTQRVTHLRLDILLLLWHFASILLFLLACWQLMGKCFTRASSRWAGVTLMAGLLTLPIAGTALYIVDQYVNPRNLAAFAAIFAVVRVLEKKYWHAAGWLIFAGAVHPLMAAFACSYCALLLVLERWDWRRASMACFLPLGLSFGPSSAAYHRVAAIHSYHYVLNWSWYEWLGIFAPIALLVWFGRLARAERLTDLQRMCRALVIYGTVYFVAAIVVAIPASLEALARLQPMRSLHLLYILTFLFTGGFLGEYILKNHVWRWLLLFLTLAAGMGFAQRSLFPNSAQVELPGAAPRNDWAKAFWWARANTPLDAFFALDPKYMEIPGEDNVGFRAIAERSHIADAGKDSGAVSMFPPLADEWLQQVKALDNWRHFTAADFQRLHDRNHVDWVVLQTPGLAGLDCPYRNPTVLICRLSPASPN